MGAFTKSLIFLRRLSVFYLFVGVFSLFFGVFYYKFIPDNQLQLNKRGFRILNQLTENFIAKDNDLSEVFANDTLRVQHKDSLDQEINKFIPFTLDTIKGIPDPARSGSSFIYAYGDTAWSIAYPLETVLRKDKKKLKDTCAIVKMSDFLDPILSARDDLFESYLLLKKIPSPKDSIHVLTILYRQDKITASGGLNVDSAFALLKNSDLSDVTDVTIGGNAYTLFYRPFNFGGSTLALAGLINKSEYEKKVKTLSVHFVAGIIEMILFGLIILPFLKFFFISPKENVRKIDVLAITFAIFLGAGVLMLSAFYFVADYSSRSRIEYVLQRLSTGIEQDIHRDLQDAGRQLDEYDSIYSLRGNEQKRVLCNPNAVAPRDLDSLMTPARFAKVLRVFWINSEGQTLAKWNPFDFPTSFGKNSSYRFFSMLQQKNKADHSTVVDAVISNATGEYQVILARRTSIPITTADPTKPNHLKVAPAFAIVMAMDLSASLRPVLPSGYGFCVVDDHSMDVLLHSDYRRNLSENLYEETEENSRLQNCIQFKHATAISDVNLYGSDQILYVKPIRDHDLTLVLFYDLDNCQQNIFRMIHFGAETMVYLAILVTLCLFISTIVVSKPAKLHFDIDGIEWIRPVKRNERSLAFTRYFFRALTLACGVSFLIVAVFGLDIRAVFYISLLMPMYALWGFVASRKKETSLFAHLETVTERTLGGFHKPESSYRLIQMALDARSIVLVIALMNWFFVRLIQKYDHNVIEVISALAIFQAFTLLFMQSLYYRTMIAPHPRLRYFGSSYVYSLYRSTLAMSLLPAFGFMWYAWRVENIQYARMDQLNIAETRIARDKFISHDYMPALKSVVWQHLSEGEKYDITNGSEYLFDEEVGEQTHRDPSHGHSPDEPYITFLDDLFLVTAGEYNTYSIQTHAADSSWFFNLPRKDVLRLYYPSKRLAVTSKAQGILLSFNGMGPFLVSLIVLAILLFLFYLLPSLLALVVNRVFMLDFLSAEFKPEGENIQAIFLSGKPDPGPDYLLDKKEYADPDRQEEYILKVMLREKDNYDQIWKWLPEEERYFLYDFSTDGYTNYRDAKTLISLVNKGLVVPDGRNRHVRLFAISFREFVLQKKGTDEIRNLKESYSVPGLWATIRIPTLIIISASAVLLLLTQESVSQRVTGLITSVGAIIPVLLDIAKKASGK